MHLVRPFALALSLSCLFTSGPSRAQGETPSVSGDDLTSKERFGPYGDNYFLYNKMNNKGWAGSDEAALRAHYSFKFTFCGPRFRRDLGSDGASASNPAPSGKGTLCPSGPTGRQIELFAAYTGEFDFYVGTRDSGPVINRVSNPGLFARVPLKALWDGDGQAHDHIELGLQHRSDGQVTEITAPRDIERAQAAYAAADRPFFDTLSRGSNFISLAAASFDTAGIAGLDTRAKLHLYINQDSAVTWGPLAGRGRNIADYDRLQLLATYKSPVGRFEAEWRLGDKALATDSVTLGWQSKSESFPLYLRVHLGAMNTLSNYTQRQDSIGFGLRFNNL